jgi:hypothetical protein
MKYILIVIGYLLLTGLSCKKSSNQQEDELPPITQTGAKTFGCLVNGKVFIPKGSDGSGRSNFKAIYEYFNGRPYLLVDARQFINGFPNGTIILSVDSAFTTGIYPIVTSKRMVNFGWDTYSHTCGVSITDSTTFKTGTINLTKVDVANGIFSGTFNCKIKPANCDTINITEGRFDYKL